MTHHGLCPDLFKGIHADNERDAVPLTSASNGNDVSSSIANTSKTAATSIDVATTKASLEPNESDKHTDDTQRNSTISSSLTSATSSSRENSPIVSTVGD